MPRVLPSLLMLTVLIGCSPVELWHRDGAPRQALASDFTSCRVRGVQDVPANTQIGRTPLVQTPPQTSCYRSGDKTRCTTTAGRIYGGEVYSYDANAGLRDDVVAQCMAAQGYRRIAVPRCTDAQVKSGTPIAGTLPTLTESSCAAQTKGGGWALLSTRTE